MSSGNWRPFILGLNVVIVGMQVARHGADPILRLYPHLASPDMWDVRNISDQPAATWGRIVIQCKAWMGHVDSV